MREYVMTPDVRREFSEHMGMCYYCQRHYKSSYNWARHIYDHHPEVFVRLFPDYAENYEAAQDA